MGYMRDATGRRLDSFEVLGADEAVDQFAAKDRIRSSVFAGTLENAYTDPFPAVLAAPPTLTASASQTLTARRVSALSEEISVLGMPRTWDATFARMPTPYLGALDFYLVGDAVEVTFTAAGTNVERFWLWVDGSPAVAAPVASGLSTAAGTNYSIKWTWGSVARRRVTIYFSSITAIGSLGVAVDALVSPAPRRLRVAFDGDSFFAGAAGVDGLLAAPFTIGRQLGVEPVLRARGGTGYLATVNSDNFGVPSRVAAIAAMDPDVIVISGSVNDSTTGLQSAAAATYAALGVACPNVPIIVFGPQPTNAIDTVSATRSSAITQVKAAALAAPNVIAFHDMVGSADTLPAAWSSATTYATGTRVSYKGSIWEAANGTGTTSGSGQTPGTNLRWKLVTWGYTGTGAVGAVVGDGTRDLYLYSDNVHPTLEGQIALATRQAAAIREDLLAYALA